MITDRRGSLRVCSGFRDDPMHGNTVRRPTMHGDAEGCRGFFQVLTHMHARAHERATAFDPQQPSATLSNDGYGHGNVHRLCCLQMQRVGRARSAEWRARSLAGAGQATEAPVVRSARPSLKDHSRASRRIAMGSRNGCEGHGIGLDAGLEARLRPPSVNNQVIIPRVLPGPFHCGWADAQYRATDCLKKR
jgi:hypothetical protein